MKVSIISPVYRVAPYIGECIRSLKAQTYADFEVLLVDDRGGDDSMEVARKAAEGDPRFRYLTMPANGGPGAARNLGIREAQGEYIAFIDSDDVWHPDFLQKLIQATQGCDLTYCQLQYRGGARDGEVHRNPVMPAGAFVPVLKRRFLRNFVTYSVCFLYRKQFLTDNDLYFPELRNSEDTHFLTRCLLLAQSIACVDEPLYYYCVREASLSTGHNCTKYKQRLAAVQSLRQAYRELCAQPRYAALHLEQYRGTMRWLYFKKGYAQAIRDVLHNLL